MLNKEYVFCIGWWCSLFILLISCNEPSTIGLDLIEDDQIQLTFKDDIPFEMNTVLEDSLLVYGSLPDFTNSFFSLPVFFCGNMIDPIFGESKASIYTEVTLDFTSPNFRLAPFEVRAVELILPYSSEAAFYGDTSQAITLEVFQLAERLNNDANYYSNQGFAFHPLPIGSLTFLPKPNVADSLFRNNGDGTFDTTAFSFVKIPLNKAIGDLLLSIDSATYSNDSTFIDIFNGLHIRASNQTPSMLGFNLQANNAGLLISYDTIRTDGTPLQYLYPFVAPTNGFFVPYRTVRTVRFEHNYENTLVSNAVGEQPNRNDLAFVQGMAGVNTVITFNNLKNLENIIVNKAELELRVAVLDGSRNDIFPPADQLLLFEVKEDGTLELIEDFTLAAFSIADIEDAIGGTLVLNAIDSQLIRYSLNLSSHFQKILKGEASNKIAVQISGKPNTSFAVIQNSTKAARPSRTILGTKNNSTFKPSLKLTYTQL